MVAPLVFRTKEAGSIPAGNTSPSPLGYPAWEGKVTAYLGMFCLVSPNTHRVIGRVYIHIVCVDLCRRAGYPSAFLKLIAREGLNMHSTKSALVQNPNALKIVWLLLVVLAYLTNNSN